VSEKDPEATITWGGYGSTIDNYREGDDRHVNTSWTVGVSLPIGGSENLLDDATFDALGDGPKISFGFNLLGFRSASANLFSPAFKDEIMAEARVQCRQTASDADELAKCNPLMPDPVFARTYLPKQEARINRALFNGFWTIGANFEAGINRFGYVSAGTLKKERTTKESFSLGLTASIFPADAMSSWTIESEYQNGFEAIDDQIICKTIIVDPNEDCLQAAPSAPKNVETLVFRIEYRRILPIGSSGNQIAFAPVASIDSLTGDYGFELPVYFVGKKKLPISPGVSIGYASKTDDVAFGVFLKTSFSF
jgi:hypothetical protein